MSQEQEHSHPDIAMGACDGPRAYVAPAYADPNHHLWQNGRLWWIAFTVHRDDWTAERLRLSLRTDDETTARHRRDWLLRKVAAQPGCQLSLRFAGNSGESNTTDDARRDGDDRC